MTKERFVYLINFIKEQDDLAASFRDVLEAMSPGCFVDAYLYNRYATELITTIKEALGLTEENEDIEYFINELNYGSEWKPGMIKEGEKDIDFSTAEKLYDCLVSYANK